MLTRTARAWLAAALTALVLLPMQAVADWADASSYLTVTQSARAFDRTNRQIFSYVTVTNTAPGAVTGPLRLVIPTSNFAVAGAAGTTAGSEPFVNLPNGLAQGASTRVRVSFTQQRGTLTFTTRPERYNTPTVTAGLPGTVFEGTAVTGTAQVSGAQGPLTYQWTQTSGVNVALSGTDTDTLTFTAPTTTGTPEVLGFTLAVTDALGVTTTATASVTVQPDDIVVDAGTDRQVSTPARPSRCTAPAAAPARATSSPGTRFPAPTSRWPMPASPTRNSSPPPSPRPPTWCWS